MSRLLLLESLLTDVHQAEGPSWPLYDAVRQACPLKRDEWAEVERLMRPGAWIAASVFLAERVRGPLETWSCDGWGNAMVGELRTYSSELVAERPDLGLLAAVVRRLIDAEVERTPER